MNPQAIARLDAAESATAAPLSNGADPAIAACPNVDAHAIEVLVVGEDDLPLADVGVALHDGRGRALGSVTRHSGLVRFTGLPAGTYALAFPEWDCDAWSALSERNTALVALRGPPGAPAWSAPPDDTGAATEHTVLPGECLAELAFHYGFALATLRAAPRNAALRKEGRSPYLLLPGEAVHIPPRRARRLQAQLDVRHVIRRHDVPEVFRVRFLDWKKEPRSGLPCVVHIVSADGRPLPDRVVRLDEDGQLRCPIPPDATAVEVRLQAGPLVEPYVFELGQMDPVESDSGLIGRALALGVGRHHDITRRPGDLLAWLRNATGGDVGDEIDIDLKRRVAALYRS